MTIGMRMLAGLGRILVSVIFILLGLAALFNWETVEHDFVGAVANWEFHAGHIEFMGEIFSRIGSMVPILIAIGVFCQIVGGVLVFLGVKSRLGAILLLIYLLPTTLLFHHFWFLEGHAMSRSLVLFLKNLSIIGALLIIVAVGNGGSFSDKGKREKKVKKSDED